MTVPKLQTDFRLPWALVKRGQKIPGQRQKVVLTFLVTYASGEDIAYRGRRLLNGGEAISGHLIRIEAIDIIARWQCRPTYSQQNTARRKLPIIK